MCIWPSIYQLPYSTKGNKNSGQPRLAVISWAAQQQQQHTHTPPQTLRLAFSWGFSALGYSYSPLLLACLLLLLLLLLLLFLLLVVVLLLLPRLLLLLLPPIDYYSTRWKLFASSYRKRLSNTTYMYIHTYIHNPQLSQIGLIPPYNNKLESSRQNITFQLALFSTFSFPSFISTTSSFNNNILVDSSITTQSIASLFFVRLVLLAPTFLSPTPKVYLLLGRPINEDSDIDPSSTICYTGGQSLDSNNQSYLLSQMKRDKHHDSTRINHARITNVLIYFRESNRITTKTIQMSSLWQSIPPVGTSNKTYQNSYRRETSCLSLSRLFQEVFEVWRTHSTFENTQQSEFEKEQQNTEPRQFSCSSLIRTRTRYAAITKKYYVCST